MNAVDFAYEVLEMQQRIEFLERELAHYKELHRINCESINRSEAHTKEMFSITLKSLLDPNSVVNKGYAAITAEKVPAGHRKPLTGATNDHLRN